MQKIKFIESELEYNVSLKLQSGRISCTFENLDDMVSAPISEGFVEINEHNGFVQSDYSNYKYVYKEDREIFTYILTTDDTDVYVEPEPVVDPDPVVDPEPYEPTEEEIAEQEKQQKISELNSQIASLKDEWSSTDYIFIKSYEASLIGENIDQYDYDKLHTERQSLREQINALEEELGTLMA